MSRPALIITAAFLNLLIGCERSLERHGCRLENEVVVAETQNVPKAVAIIALKTGGFSGAFAANDAVWATRMNESGEPIKQPLRILKQSDPATLPNFSSNESKAFWPREDRVSIKAEHLALVETSGNRQLLLALERSEQEREGGAYAVSCDLSWSAEPVTMRIGAAGEHADKITAAPIGEKVIVAWHEGRINGSEVILARMSPHPLAVEAIAKLTASHPVFDPSLASMGETVYLAWMEVIQESGEPRSTVNVAVLNPDLKIQDRTVVHKGKFLEASPNLAIADGRIGLVFRDDMDGDSIAEYYFAALNIKGKIISAPARISQADGRRGPALVFCGKDFIAATIRSFHKSLLIGINQFDFFGIKKSGEFQIYADKTEFVHVDLAANEAGAVMLYAEDRMEKGRILAAQLNCR